VVVWYPSALSFLSVRACWIMDEIGFENYTRWPLAGKGLALVVYTVVDLDVFVDLGALRPWLSLACEIAGHSLIERVKFGFGKLSRGRRSRVEHHRRDQARPRP
jgi:hypothetical protein